MVNNNNTGAAFNDALSLLRYRYNYSYKLARAPGRYSSK